MQNKISALSRKLSSENYIRGILPNSGVGDVRQKFVNSAVETEKKLAPAKAGETWTGGPLLNEPDAPERADLRGRGVERSGREVQPRRLWKSVVQALVELVRGLPFVC